MTTTQAPAPAVDTTAQLHDEFEQQLETDPVLSKLYMNGLVTLKREWNEEQVAIAAFHRLYGEDTNIDHLMQAWRWQRSLENPNDPDHAKAWDVREAVQRMKAKQAVAAHV